MAGAAGGVGGPGGPPSPSPAPKPAPAGKGRKGEGGSNKPPNPKPKGKGKSSSGKLPKGVVDVRKLKTAKRAVNAAEPQVEDLISFMKKVKSDLRKIARSAGKMAGQLSGHRSAFVAVICCLLGLLISAAIFGDAFRNIDHLVWTLWAGVVSGSLSYLAVEALEN